MLPQEVILNPVNLEAEHSPDAFGGSQSDRRPSTALMRLIDIDERSSGSSNEYQHDRANSSCKRDAGKRSGPTVAVGDYNAEFETT